MSKTHSAYLRFDIGQRLEHGLLMLSFTLLAISGLPQKYPDSNWGSALIAALGGIEATRLLHHAAAVVLIAVSGYHVLMVAYRIFVRQAPLTMLPGKQDVRDALHMLAYNLGFAQTPPRMGRYTFGEKFEYWAVVWGTVIMMITGFMLWNPIATARFLPGQFIPAAKAAHGGEALLAVLAILTWHVYNVHVKCFNPSMFTGRLSEREMVEEHPLELAALKAGRIPLTVPPDVLRRRRSRFIPIAIIVSTILCVGLYWFVTFEQTAITTIPRYEVEIYVPATPTP